MIDLDKKAATKPKAEEKSVRFRRKADAVGHAQVHHVITMDPLLSDRAVRLYSLLLKYAQQKGECWPGIERMTKDLGWSDRKTKRAVAELVKRGLITRQRRMGTSSITWIEDVDEIYEEELAKILVEREMAQS